MRKNRIIIGMSIIILLIIVNMVSATEYYLNDTTHGGNISATNCTNSNNPCGSLSQIPHSPDYNSNVNFAYGNTFRGDDITANRNNVTYKAYGDNTQPLPKIKGSEYLNNSNTSCFYNITSTLWEMNTTCLTLVNDPHMIYRNTTGDNGVILTKPNLISIANMTQEWEFYYVNNTIVIKTNGSNPLSYANGIEIPKYNNSESTVNSFMFFNTDSNNIIQNLKLMYIRESAIDLYAGNNITIKDSEIQYAWTKVIYLGNGIKNAVINNVTLKDVGIRGYSTPYGLEAQGEVIWSSGSTTANITISNNTLIRAGGVPINIVRTNGWTKVSGNQIINCSTSGAGTGNDWTAGIYFDGADNGIINNNNISNCNIGIHIGNEVAGYTADNNNITYNTVTLSKITDMLIDCTIGTNGYCTNNTNVQQNTFYKTTNTSGSGYGNQIFMANASNITFKNNIIFNNYTSTSTGTLILYKNNTAMINNNLNYNSYNSTSGRNIYDKNTGTYSSLLTWQTAMNKDLNSITSNPQFITGTLTPTGGNAVCTASETGSYIGAIPCGIALVLPVTNLQSISSNSESIYITWTNPVLNFNNTQIWIQNGTWINIYNTTNEYYNITGLSPATSYNIMAISVGTDGRTGSNSTTGASTTATTNLTNTFYLSHQFTNLSQSSGGCSGVISLASNGSLPVQVCVNDMSSDVYCYNYSDGSVGLNNVTYLNYTLQYGTEYRLHYIWNMIQYVNMNDSGINGQYDVGTVVAASVYSECQNIRGDSFESQWYNLDSTSADPTCYNVGGNAIISQKVYYGTTCTSPVNYNVGEVDLKGLPGDYRVFVGQSGLSGSEASGSCGQIQRRFSSSTCYVLSGNYFVMQSCVPGVQEYVRYPLCSFAVGDVFTDSFVYYGNAEVKTVTSNGTLFSVASLGVQSSGNAPSDLIINSPLSSDSIMRFVNISYVVVGTDYDHINISLLNSDLSFNQTLVGNNGLNSSYFWDVFSSGLNNSGLYYLRVSAILVNGSVAISSYRSFSVVYDAGLNVSAFNNNSGVPIIVFSVNITDLSSGVNSFVVAGDNVSLFNISKGHNYSVQFFSSSYNQTSIYYSNYSNFQFISLNIIIPSLSVITSGSCGQSTGLFFNLLDEDNLSGLSGVFSYNFVVTVANTSVSAFGNVSGGNFSLCVNASTDQGWIVSSGLVVYGSAGYVTRHYYVFGGTRLSNVTTNISLYDLSSGVATAFQVSATTQSLDVYSNRYLGLIRWYPGLNSYRVVDMGLLDDNGQSVVYVRTQDTDYRLAIYELDGSIIYLANPIRMVCVSSPCTYSLKGGSTSFIDLSGDSIEYSLDYNDSTSIWTLLFNDPSQRTSLMNLSVYKDTGTSTIQICSSTVSAYTGALSCNSSGYDGLLRAVVYRSASPPRVLVEKLLSVLGVNPFSSGWGVFLTFLVALPIVLFFAVISPIVALIGGVLALVVGVFLGSLSWGFVGAFAVLAFITAHFIRRQG